MKFVGTCYRAHDPKWSYKPLSGAGAAIRGARFNPKGCEALCLSLAILTAVKEANQGFPFKISPCVLCSYDVDIEHIADLSTERGRATHDVDLADMSSPWFSYLAKEKEPPSWSIARRLIGTGHAGVLVPSFAPGATEADRNLVLWFWSSGVTVFDPSGRLPKDQLSWT